MKNQKVQNINNLNKDKIKKPKKKYHNKNNNRQINRTNQKNLIQNFLQEGLRIGQIFQQTEDEYKRFLKEGQKLPEFDRNQFAYWKGYLMSTQNLQNIFEFEGKILEYQQYIQQLRQWEEQELLQIYQQNSVQQKNNQLNPHQNHIYLDQQMGHQFNRIQTHSQQSNLSTVMEVSTKQEESCAIDLIKSMEQKQCDFNIEKYAKHQSAIEEDEHENDHSDDNMQENVGDEKSNQILQSTNISEQYYQNQEKLNNEIKQKQFKHHYHHDQKGLVLPQSQQIQLHPNQKQLQNQTSPIKSGLQKQNNKIQNKSVNSPNDQDLVQFYYNNQEQQQSKNSAGKKLSGKELDDKLRQIQVFLNDIWEAHHIPHNHRELYVKCNKNLQREILIDNIEKEIDLLKQRRAPIQNCIRAIKARESCLNQLKQKIQQLPNLKNSQDIQELKSIIEKISEFIVHLRILSLNVVESILRWRQNLSQSLHHAIQYQKRLNRDFKSSSIQISYMPFIYNNENYLTKMTEDTLNLCNTDLKDFVCFSKTYDPFFLAAQKAKMGGQSLTILHEIKPAIIQRIRASELILVEEQLYTKIEEASNIYSLSLFDLFEDDIQKVLPGYFNKLEKLNKVNFDSTQSEFEKVHEQIKTQQEISILQYKSERTQETEGLAIIHLDKTQYSLRRIDILHISVLKPKHFLTMLEKTLQFIWENDHCSEIRTALVHFQQTETDKLAADKELTQHLKSFGFKWKSLLNDKNTGKRTTVFAIKRDAEKLKQINEKYSLSGKQDEPIQLKTCYLLSEQKTNKKLENPQYTVFDNSPALVSCLKVLLGEENEEKKEILKKIPNQYIQHLMQMLDNFYKFVDSETLGTSTSDIIKNPVYIIQTDDINVNAFVINLEQNEMDQITTGHFHEFIQQIIKDCQNKKQFDKELWIPAFRKKIQFNNVPQMLDTDIYQTCASQIDFGLDYSPPIQGGLKIKQINEGSVFIRAPFLFGLIHGETAEALDFPIFTTLVSREDY
ncbi:hypothetical protein PPERSA_12512 [Pseudocohnilembus persalinus]|uniref:Uncharacterized protein n=1 Tax=Pseudocohnilembus persalinus TaxID=266149 RepID=A0A0V0QPL0_PSEPJ|nr:hypothetical protein PPERSA_12512 [Pseudocohnilembus persalinus]|eukprot:KRX04065.1 hypothetical protein PPERSA_12512 [Pseudocohnilembus persalinus]